MQKKKKKNTTLNYFGWTVDIVLNIVVIWELSWWDYLKIKIIRRRKKNSTTQNYYLLLFLSNKTKSVHYFACCHRAISLQHYTYCMVSSLSGSSQIFIGVLRQLYYIAIGEHHIRFYYIHSLNVFYSHTCRFTLWWLESTHIRAHD